MVAGIFYSSYASKANIVNFSLIRIFFWVLCEPLSLTTPSIVTFFFLFYFTWSFTVCLQWLWTCKAIRLSLIIQLTQNLLQFLVVSTILLTLFLLYSSGALTHSVKALDISLKIDTELALQVGRRTNRAWTSGALF